MVTPPDAATGRESMRSLGLFDHDTYKLCVGPWQARVARKPSRRKCGPRRRPAVVTVLQNSLRRRDTTNDMYVAGELCRTPHKTSVGRFVRWWARTAWHYPCQPRAATSGSSRASVSASYSGLIVYILTSLLVRGAIASWGLDTAGDGTTSKGDTRFLFSPDNTLFSKVPPPGRAYFQRRIEREDLTSQSEPVPRTLLQPSSRLTLDKNGTRNPLSEGTISPGVTHEPPTVVLPQKSGIKAQLSRVEREGNSFVATQERLATQSDAPDFGQPREDQWVCRISVGYGSCGWRAAEGRGSGWFCPSGHCCSKTACKGGECLGGWCIHNSSALCWIRDDSHASGGCSCQSHGRSCSGNAICHTMEQPDGGAYCTCAQHFLGDGKTCEANPCQLQPCSPGTCSPRGNSYVCDCPTNTHELSETDPPACVAKKNPCMTDPCGPPAVVDSCLNFEADYECICKDGYVSENGICEKVDWCKDDPCGPPVAVHDCVSMGMGFKCYCQRGYTRQRDDEGLEFCEEDFCAGNPCGAPELVKSCTNRGRRRASTETDEHTEAYPRYSCLCSDVAELKIDPETLEGRCVRADPCKGDPCGPPEAVAQCFVQGLSYGCTCKAGYTAQHTGENNDLKCVAGDPCVLHVCGPDEFVDRCTTDGKTYTCHCSDEGFLSVEANGVQLCRSKALCEENCGPTNSVKQCTPSEDTYNCVCKKGFLLAYNKGKKSCVAGDPCAVAPCGSAQAVAECRREDYGYSCVCNRGFELRTRPDETQLCAEPQSCVGDPCGPAAAVELCLPGKYTFSCQCREPYVVKEIHGRQRCTISSNESEDKESKPQTDTGEKTESGEQPVGLLAGVAIVGVVLVGSAYAGFTYVRKRRQHETPESWDAEESHFPDLVGEGAPYPSGDRVAVSTSEQGRQETALLPSPSAWG